MQLRRAIASSIMLAIGFTPDDSQILGRIRVKILEELGGRAVRLQERRKAWNDEDNEEQRSSSRFQWLSNFPRTLQLSSRTRMHTRDSLFKRMILYAVHHGYRFLLLLRTDVGVRLVRDRSIRTAIILANLSRCRGPRALDCTGRMETHGGAPGATAQPDRAAACRDFSRTNTPTG